MLLKIFGLFPYYLMNFIDFLNQRFILKFYHNNYFVNSKFMFINVQLIEFVITFI